MHPYKSKREYYTARLGGFRRERQSFMTHWQELAEFVQPRRGRFLISDVNKGRKRHQSIINSRGTKSYEQARAGMLAGVMSPARPWFELGVPNPDLMEYKPVKIWFNGAEQLLYHIFATSNLYSTASQMIGELLLFGTGCMSHTDSFDTVARFQTHTAGSYFLAQDADGKVNTFVREYMMTVEQMVAKYGVENVSQMVRNAYDTSNYDAWYPVVQFVQPNMDTIAGKLDARNKPWSSCHFEPGNNDKEKLLRESGFDEFPVYAPRWDVTGEDIYGTSCPGMVSLGDIKGLQIEERRKAQGIDKVVNPPLQGPGSVRNVKLSNLPGGVTIYDYMGDGQGIRPLYEVRPDIAAISQDIDRTERRIAELWYVDLFLAITNMEGIQPRNQREIIERNGERLLQLGPVLEQLHGSFLAPLIDRTFNQAVRAGLIPEPPPELEEGSEIKVTFISSLAQAQRAVATGGIERLSGFVASLRDQGYQGYKFDDDQAIDEYAKVLGVPPRIVRSDDEVKSIMDKVERERQEQRALEAMRQGSEVARNVGQANVT